MNNQYYTMLKVTCTILLLLLLQLGWVVRVNAQTPEAVESTPTPVPADNPNPEPALPAPEPSAEITTTLANDAIDGSAVVTFDRLNQSTFELHAPLSQQSLVFELPYHWDIRNGNNYIELAYDLQFEGQFSSTLPIDPPVNSVLNVYLGDTLLTSFNPLPGLDHTRQITISQEAIAELEQRRYQLRFVFFTTDCSSTRQSMLTIRDESYINFEYTQIPLVTNLANFPHPLVKNFFRDESIVLVIPDNYSDSDLSAAASVAASLGHRTFNGVALDIITASEATDERLADTSAVIIGQPQDNAFLQDLYVRNRLPTTLADNGNDIVGPADRPISAGDGVIQEVLSDFNPEHVYLIVSGNSDQAVERAAQGLSALSPSYGFDGNLVVIAEFHDVIDTFAQSIDTFGLFDLGFRDTTMYGIETQEAAFRFTLPPQKRLAGTPELSLVYINSAELRSGISGLMVKLNDKLVGSVPFDGPTFGERRGKIELSPGDFNAAGYNRITFEPIINLEFDGCALPDIELFWVRVSENSELYLPMTNEDENTPPLPPTLRDPLRAFATTPDLSDVWFSLTENSTQAELMGMINVASWLGNFSSGSGFAPKVSREPIEDINQLEPYQIIAFGLPTDNQLIVAINDLLPQPFVAGENNLSQQTGNVVYRLPQLYDLGLLQILPTPWDPRKNILIATGTTEQGVDQAISTLTNNAIYYILSGDVTFIRDEYIETFESKRFIRVPALTALENLAQAGESLSAELVVAEPTPAVGMEAESEAPISEINETGTKSLPSFSLDYRAASTSPPELVNKLIIGLIGFGLFIIVLGTIVSLRRSRKSKDQNLIISKS